MSESYSYIKVTSQFSCAAQPGEAEFALLASEGFQYVINLGLEEAPYALANEEGIVTSLGMKYQNIPVAFDGPLLGDFKLFFEAMEKRNGQRVLVHCAANKRASCFIALWLERQGWNSEQGDKLIHQVWQPDSVWQRFLWEMREQFLL